MRKLLKGQCATPHDMITDKLRSYDAAKRQIMPGVEHRSHKGLHSRAENSHLHCENGDRLMRRFCSPGALQRVTSVFSAVRNISVPLPSICIASG